MPRRTAIVTHDGDLHALIVRDRLQQEGMECSIIASDALAGSPGLTWYLSREDGAAVCTDTQGAEVRVADLDLVWWRRMPPEAPPQGRKQGWNVVDRFASNSIRASLLGLFLADFTGVWLDHPTAVARASNKVLQLRVAASAGLRVPRTLLSQDPRRVREFFAEVGEAMVVKAVAGVLGTPSLTGQVTSDHLAEDGPIRACPALYQELIPGRRHLRVHCFGGEIRCALIESDLLDWRHPLNVDVRPVELPEKLGPALLTVLRQFDLRMGIFDLKWPGDGEPVWLELNPQGQFLFIEALGGGDLVGPFVGFLRGLLAES